LGRARNLSRERARGFNETVGVGVSAGTGVGVNEDEDVPRTGFEEEDWPTWRKIEPVLGARVFALALSRHRQSLFFLFLSLFLLHPLTLPTPILHPLPTGTKLLLHKPGKRIYMIRNPISALVSEGSEFRCKV
jgi:hypothetical protein